jgi:L-fuconolactonase
MYVMSDTHPVYERYPGLKGVIDHFAKPDMSTGQSPDEWRSWIVRYARIPNLYCKISGLLTEAGDDWSAERISPYVHFVIEKFGFDRVMGGGDGPIATFKTVREAVGSMDPADEAKLYWETAVRFYDPVLAG